MLAVLLRYFFKLSCGVCCWHVSEPSRKPESAISGPGTARSGRIFKVVGLMDELPTKPQPVSYPMEVRIRRIPTAIEELRDPCYLSVEQLLRLPVEIQSHIVDYLRMPDMLYMARAAPILMDFITAVPKFWVIAGWGQESQQEQIFFWFVKRLPTDNWAYGVANGDNNEQYCQLMLEGTGLMEKCDLGTYIEHVTMLCNNSRVGLLYHTTRLSHGGEPWTSNIKETTHSFDAHDFVGGSPFPDGNFHASVVVVDWSLDHPEGLLRKVVHDVNRFPSVKELIVNLTDLYLLELPEVVKSKVPAMKVYCWWKLPDVETWQNNDPKFVGWPIEEYGSMAANILRTMIAEWLNGEREIACIMILPINTARILVPTAFKADELREILTGLTAGLLGCFRLHDSAWLIRRSETSREGLVISVQPQLFLLCGCDYWVRRERTFEDSKRHAESFASLCQTYSELKSGYINENAEDDEDEVLVCIPEHTIELESKARSYLDAYDTVSRRDATCDFAITSSLYFDYDRNWFKLEREVRVLLESYRHGDALHYFPWD